MVKNNSTPFLISAAIYFFIPRSIWEWYLHYYNTYKCGALITKQEVVLVTQAVDERDKNADCIMINAHVYLTMFLNTLEADIFLKTNNTMQNFMK